MTLTIAAADSFTDTQHKILEELIVEHGKELELLTNWQNASELERGRWLEAARTIEPEKAEELGADELTQFGATFVLTERLLADRVAGKKLGVYFNPAGGELTGQHDGVKVFNDLAHAAVRLAGAGLRVAVLDLDAHHTNELEAILRSYPEVLTVSIHELSSAATTFSSPEDGFVNRQLGDGAGDTALVQAVNTSLLELSPELDVLLMSIGTDGLEDDPGSALNYSPEGLAGAVVLVSAFLSTTGASLLVGAGSTSDPALTATLVSYLSTGLLLGSMA